MQYENGCWLFKEGYAAFWPTEAYAVTKSETAVTITAPSGNIDGRGATLGGVNLTVRMSAPAPEVLRVEAWHHKGGVSKGPEFRLLLPESGVLDMEDAGNALIVRSGSLNVEIQKKPWRLIFRRGGEFLTRSGEKDLCYVKEHYTNAMYDRPGGAWMSERLSLSVDELIYGLGERFGPFVKNGQTVVIRNEDGGTSSAQAYKNIPFYLSSRGYGVFVNHPETVEFEVGTEQVSRVGFAVQGEKLDYFLLNGPTMKDVLMRYTDLTGKPALPPQWSFGLWLSTSFTTSYDTETVLSFVDGMLDRGIPLSVFHFDCGWLRDFHWTDFVWDDKVFRDPVGLLRQLHDRGIKVCVWINSYMGQDGALFDEGMKKGYFIRRTDGSVWQWDMWQPGLAVVDFTNPDAVKWYQAQLSKLLDMGVDCFKTDFGERIPDEDVVYFDGSDPKKMHNYYTYLYNKAVFDLLREKKGESEALVFARSATAGCQQFPVHWGGDCWSDYDAMAQSLRGGLSFLSSGFGFWAHDIGGFEDTSTADVYKRWLAFGLLSTHSRLHGSSSYRVPWLYDEEAVEVCRFFTKLKLSLLPYLYSAAYETSRTGVPMVRSMAMEFEGDYNCRYLDKQYILGDSLLVAPIFNEEGLARYYLPAGTWVNFLTGEAVSGGIWREETHDYFSLPLWVKENSIIPVCIDAPDVNVRFPGNVEFRVYALTDRVSSIVYQDGERALKLSLRPENGEIAVNADAPGCRVRFVNRPDIRVKGYPVTKDGNDGVIPL